MIRTSLVFSILATAAAAQTPPPKVSYNDALALTAIALPAEIDKFGAATGPGQYFTQLLDSEGILVQRSPDASLTLFDAELVGFYDKSTSLCTFGYDVDAYAKLPRTAARAVAQAARDNDWPAKATGQIEMRGPECFVRAGLATVAGGLVMVYPLDTGDSILYLGMTDLGRAP